MQQWVTELMDDSYLAEPLKSVLEILQPACIALKCCY